MYIIRKLTHGRFVDPVKYELVKTVVIKHIYVYKISYLEILQIKAK